MDIYINQEISFVQSDRKYPVGKLCSEYDEILIHFLHYSSEQEALEAWKRRCKRINWDNIFVLCCDEDLTYEEIVEFDRLEYKNKIIFLSKELPEIRCGIFTKEFQDKTDARLLNFANPLGKRFYQNYIDYVKWLNGDTHYIL